MGRTLREIQSVQMQIGTYLQTVNDLQSQLDQLVASRSLANLMPNNQKQMLNINAELDRVRGQLDSTSEMMAKVTGRLTFDSTVELFTDLRTRLEQTQNTYQNWRKTKAVFDLNLALSNFAKEGEPGVTQAEAEQQVANAEKEFVAALGLSDEIAPSIVAPSSNLIITG